MTTKTQSMYIGIHCACIALNWTKQCMILQF